MINKVKVYAYRELLTTYKNNPDTDVYISIRDCNEVNEMPDLDGRVLKLQFWDWGPGFKCPLHLEGYDFEKDPDFGIFDADQADQIINHLNKWDEFGLGKARTLHVNCEAGICRSGAVATFAINYLSLDYETFIANNSWIRPNAHVLSLLNRLGIWESYFETKTEEA